MKAIVPVETIEKKILLIRGHKVMLDSDLAILYGVTTKRLNEQVRRNLRRFPPDFMFQLTSDEVESLRSQFATSKRGGRGYLPYVFTEQGVAMLSSALNSERTAKVNMELMRTFEIYKGEQKVLARALRYCYNIYVKSICPPLNQLSHESARCPQRGFVFLGGKHAR